MISATGWKLLLVLISFTETVHGLTVTAHYPKSSLSLSLRGDSCGLNWEKGLLMKNIGDQTTWTIDLNCPSGTTKIEMKVLIDDKIWMLGSNHHFDLSVDPSLPSTEIYPWFYSYHGILQVMKNIYSKELNNFRDVIYYLPPSYAENTLKKYSNILIMHDGQNLFNRSTAYMGNAWMCQDALDQSIITGLADEIIIVGPYNTADRIDEYTYIYDPSEDAGGKGDLYLDWIESTLIPFTTTTYPRTSITREKLGILGSSLGGLISCYAVWTRSHIYGKAGCMSSSFWWNENHFQNVIIPSTVPVKPFPMIYMDSGTGSPGETQCTAYTMNIFEQMLQDGYEDEINVKRYVDEGATHSESYWGPRFHIPIEFLYNSVTV
jgi:predicted alpha/beta superfamily hydrolase